VLRSTFAVLRSTFAVQRSTFAVQRSSFDVLRSTFAVLRSSSMCCVRRRAERRTEHDERRTDMIQGGGNGVAVAVERL
jgi:hypothetical protein